MDEEPVDFRGNKNGISFRYTAKLWIRIIIIIIKLINWIELNYYLYIFELTVGHVVLLEQFNLIQRAERSPFVMMFITVFTEAYYSILYRAIKIHLIFS